MDALLTKYQTLYKDGDDAAAYSSNTNARNVKTEPADNISCNSSDIDQPDWDAVKELENDVSDDDDLDQETEDKMINTLEDLAKKLFPTSTRSNGISVNSIARSLPTTSRTSLDFDTFYVKSCKEFIQTRDEKLKKQRKQKEEEENKKITLKPNLVSKQARKKHVPLVEKMKAMELRKAQAIEKAKKEREEQEQKELEKLTFKPNINEISKALMNYNNKEEVIERLHLGKGVGKDKDNNEEEAEKLFRPNINKKSSHLAQNVIKKTSSKVEDRLLLQASATEAKKAKLLEASMPNFTPSLNKNSQRIMEQFTNRETINLPKTNDQVLQGLENQPDLSLKRFSEVFAEKNIPRAAPNTDRPSSKKIRMDEVLQDIQVDDNLLGNLHRLTVLLRAEDSRPNSTRNQRYY